eukprot:scaffold209868_cov18-Tisochrysis_lutea.AAC.1
MQRKCEGGGKENLGKLHPCIPLIALRPLHGKGSWSLGSCLWEWHTRACTSAPQPLTARFPPGQTQGLLCLTAAAAARSSLLCRPAAGAPGMCRIRKYTSNGHMLRQKS